jgi:hypothetical protein
MNNEQQQIIDEAYENYCKSFENQTLIEQYSFDTDPMTQFMFLNKCKTNPEFSERWGLKIEERELTLLERVRIYGVDKIQTNDAGYYEHSYVQFKVDEAKIPTKQITITYNDKKIESYK